MAEYSLGDRGTLKLVTNDFYDEEILQVFEELQIDREKIWNGEARLVPEANNPYEPRSIAVYIDDMKIGRMSPEDSAAYWNPICRVVASGYEPITHLQLSAVLRKSNDESYIDSEGLVSLSPPHSLFPLNQAPTQATLLPQGPSMKVLDEKDYSEYLHSILPPSGEGRVILSLEANTLKQHDGSLIDSVEVFHDRKKVGRLSTQMSLQLAPVIRHAFEHNKLTSAWGTIRGNAFELSLTVQAARAADLPEEWFTELPNNVPDLIEEAEDYAIADNYQPTSGENSRQTSAKKKRGLVGSLASSDPSSSEPQRSKLVEGSKSQNPNQRIAFLLGLLGALLIVTGVVVVFAKPMLGIIGIVLGASIVFLGIFMSRSTEQASESLEHNSLA